MFTYAIRNIVHKQASKDINILYYPDNDLIDDIITDLDANFFIAESFRNKIQKNNVCYVSNISLFEYDLILCYDINNNIVDLSSRLHIPIIVYLKYGSYDDTKIPDHPNVYYIIEHEGRSEQDKLLTVIPTIDKTIHNEDSNVCLFINTDRDYGDLIPILTSSIQNLSIVDQEKINQNAMIEILSKHKICIDLHPKSIYKLMYCAKGNLPYIVGTNEITTKYNSIYDGVFLMPQNLDSLLDLIKRLISSNTIYTNNFPNDTNNNIELFLQKIKTRGLVL